MDLPKIKIVRSDVNVWLIYAGSRRRHFEQFRSSKRVFLDLPGFSANATTFADESEVAQRLAMSRAVRHWVLNQDGAPPPRNLAAYQPETYPSGSTNARSLAAELGNIKRMFRDAAPGDLVICPPIGHYNKMLIGEIVGAFSPTHAVGVRYWDGEEVPARKIRWLATDVTRRKFSSPLARSLQNQHAISQVDESFTEEILRRTYPNFSWRDKSKIDVFGENYTGEDPTQLNSTAILLKYCAAAAIAIDRDELDVFRRLDQSAAIARFYDRQEIDHFRVNFNSPGKFEAIIRSCSGSAVMTALLSFAKNEAGGQRDADEIGQKVKSSISGAGAVKINSDVDRLIASLRDDDWAQLEKLGDEASTDLDIELEPKAGDDGE